jgi:glutamate dehydrogenase (NAD(P)+)
MYPLDNTGSCTVSNGPVKIIKWKDKQTKAIGWIVIHSLINGIAGGGLFMHAKATLQEVSDLAKSMSYKNCIIKNPQMGGAKGGIKFDANHPEAQNVLARFLIDNKAIIENLWCTGGDLNTSNEIIETIVKRELGFPSAALLLKYGNKVRLG